jgi:hypothetical protein
VGVLWSWVESVPGTFAYDDYDRLVELAEKNRLKVVLSTIAEIQPHWIFREAPGSEMIDNFGNRVVSSLRGECNFGLTPGGCTDHPEVWARMKNFLQETGRHFKDAPNLHGWDVWNELRWNVPGRQPGLLLPAHPRRLASLARSAPRFARRTQRRLETALRRPLGGTSCPANGPTAPTLK